MAKAKTSNIVKPAPVKIPTRYEITISKEATIYVAAESFRICDDHNYVTFYDNSDDEILVVRCWQTIRKMKDCDQQDCCESPDMEKNFNKQFVR